MTDFDRSTPGMNIHAGKCEWRNEYEVEQIIDHRGPTIAKQYHIKWKNYPKEFNTWEPRGNVHPELIRDYEITNNAYDHNWKFRCDVCDLPCSSKRGIGRYSQGQKAQTRQGTIVLRNSSGRESQSLQAGSTTATQASDIMQ